MGSVCASQAETAPALLLPLGRKGQKGLWGQNPAAPRYRIKELLKPPCLCWSSDPCVWRQREPCCLLGAILTLQAGFGLDFLGKRPHFIQKQHIQDICWVSAGLVWRSALSIPNPEQCWCPRTQGRQGADSDLQVRQCRDPGS